MDIRAMIDHPWMNLLDDTLEDKCSELKKKAEAI